MPIGIFLLRRRAQPCWHLVDGERGPSLARVCDEAWLGHPLEISHGCEDLGKRIIFTQVGFAVMSMAMMLMLEARRFCVASGVFQLVLVQIVDSYHLGQRLFAGFDQ